MWDVEVGVQGHVKVNDDDIYLMLMMMLKCDFLLMLMQSHDPVEQCMSGCLVCD